MRSGVALVVVSGQLSPYATPATTFIRACLLLPHRQQKETKVQVGYKRLCDKLLSAVKQKLRSKQQPQVDFAEAEVAMLRLEKLSVQSVQRLPLLRGLAPRLLTLVETVGTQDPQDPHLLGTTQILLQLQVGQVVYAIHELQGNASAGDDEAAESATDLQQKRTRIQIAVDELLPSLCRAVQVPSGRLRAMSFEALLSSLVVIKMPVLQLLAADEAVRSGRKER